MAGLNWTCPYCQHVQTVTDVQKFATSTYFDLINNHYGKPVGSWQTVICCANKDCKNIEVHFAIGIFSGDTGRWLPRNYGDAILHIRVMPQSGAKVLPSYIPKPLVEDYSEACSIRDLSPKASATLARRCLQGMIRDFCRIAKARLVDEIKALRQALDDGTGPQGVSIESVDAIDQVRTVGNIGAHMEKDIDHIVSVDPGEAQLMIELVESLFDEWYIARHKRQRRFEAIAAMAEEKKIAIAAPPKPKALPKA